MLELARVVAIHPASHRIDVVLLRTGQRAAGIPVMAASASSYTGLSDLPPVNAPAGDARWEVPARSERDAVAVLAPTRAGNWICLGFKTPEHATWLDAEAGRHVYRHASGVRHVIQADSTVRVEHPSGATVTIAADGKVTVKAIATLTVDTPKAVFTGDVEAAGDVKAGTISLKTHKHGGVQVGGQQTGQPVP